MIIFRILRTLLSLYSLLLIFRAILPLATDNTQKPWMVKVEKWCAPGMKVGRNLAAKLFANREINADMSALIGAVLCIVLSVILGWLF